MNQDVYLIINFMKLHQGGGEGFGVSRLGWCLRDLHRPPSMKVRCV